MSTLNKNFAIVNTLLDTLSGRLPIWKCGASPVPTRKGISTGFAMLDNALPDGGWPRGALSELLTNEAGIGELSLMLPALARVTTERGLLLIAPPFVPYAPALAQSGLDLGRLLVLPSCAFNEALAAAEMTLRSGACGAVLLWESGLQGLPSAGIPYAALQRLHLAAGRGDAMAIAYRSQRQSVHPSPAPLRIRLGSDNGQLRLSLFKRRGLYGEQTLSLDPFPAALQQQIAHQPVMPAWYSIPSSRLERRHALAN